MQTDRPLLTIAIPTYNRSRDLQELLAVLAPQLDDQPAVELLISDNASPDGTPEVIKGFVDGGLVCRVIRNEVNVGPDGNFLQCFEQARGKYVWIFSDDDMIPAGALKRIVELISAGDYSLIYINAYIFEHHGEASRRVRARAPQVFKSNVAFAAMVHVFFTFISGNIVNKDCVLGGRRDLSALVGTNLAQLGWTYAALGTGGSHLYIHERLIGNRANNTGGYALCEIFGINIRRITEERLEGSGVAKVILNGTIMRFLPSHIYALRASGTSSAFFREEPHKVLRTAYGDNLRYWLFIYPIIFLPRLLARGWLFLGRVLNKADKIVGNPLMRLS
ncbi:MAG TPA: glycosyltransferase family 2 protein [Acidisarcina sp.]